MLSDLLKGNVRLVIVYWVFGVFAGFLFRLLDIILQKHYFTLMQSSYGLALLYGFILLPFIYFPFIYIAIWRSADKYTGWKVWAILAKFAVILGTLILVVTAYTVISTLTKTTSTPQEIAANTEVLNRSLPVMIDNDTELTRTTVDQKALTYHFRIVNQEASQMDIPKFNALMKKQLFDTACSRNDVKKITSSGLAINYEYVDKNGHPITTINFKESDCTK